MAFERRLRIHSGKNRFQMRAVSSEPGLKRHAYNTDSLSLSLSSIVWWISLIKASKLWLAWTVLLLLISDPTLKSNVKAWHRKQ
jgi:hypothetical protein